MNKKILLMFVIVLFLVGTVSAVRVDYSDEDMTAHIKDTILFGLINIGEQGTMELKSHSSVTEILEVGLGEQVVMYYDTNFGKAHQDALGDVSFINMKTGKEVKKDWKYVYWKEFENEKAVYEYTDTVSENGTIIEGIEQIGTEIEMLGSWANYNSKDIPKGQIRIGVMVNNLEGDYIDGIWEVQGKKIKKHAEWTAGLNTDLISYWKLDETSGSTAFDSIGNYNGTNSGATINQAGKIETSYNFSSDRIVLPNVTLLEDTTGITISTWLYPDSFPTASEGKNVFFNLGGTDLVIATRGDAGNVGKIAVYEPTQSYHFTTGTISLSTWTHVLVTANSSILQIYFDGTLAHSSALNSWTINNPTADNQIGDERNIGRFYDGKLDEIGMWKRVLTTTEITQLYNGGDGITYTPYVNPSPVITLETPSSNNTNFYNPIVDFECLASDNVGLTNVSLIINGTVVDTDLSPINASSSWFEYTIPLGASTWTCDVYDDEDTRTIADEEWVTFTNDLAITLGTPANTTNSSTNNIDFTGTASDDTAVVNVSLIINATYNGTDTTVVMESCYQESANVSNQTGIDGACDLNYSGSYSGTLLDVNLNSIDGDFSTYTGAGSANTELYINYTIPNGALNSSLWYLKEAGSGQIDQNFTIPNSCFYGDILQFRWNSTAIEMNISCYNNSNWELINYTIGLGVRFYEEAMYWNMGSLVNFDRTLADGFYNWTMEACDAYACVNASARSITIDTTNPAVSISAPTTPIAFHEINTTLFLNWSINDTHLSSCWYNYLNANTTLTCADNTTNVNITDTVNKTILVYANDTFGNVNSSSVTWDYTFFQTGKSFNAFAYETDDEDYSINLTIPAAVSDISSFLNYNGTTYAADSDCTGTACYISSSLDIPLMDTTDANELNPFNWVITTLTGSATATLTTDTENQNVSIINMSKCGTGHSAVLFNISKESDNTPLNVSSFDATFKYYIGGGSVVKTEKSSQTALADYDYCIVPNETYIVSSTIFLDATGYESRNFDFSKLSYDNLSQTIQPLRLANTTVQTVSNIIVEVSDSGLAPLENILVNISRYFPATDSYLLVESQITDEFGEMSAKLIENDVKYKFQFFNSAGTLLKTSDKTTIACRASICVLPFVIESTLDNLDRYDLPSDYNSPGIKFNNVTNTFSYFWDDQTGNSASTNLEVVRYTFNESSTVCSTTSTSALSTLTCAVGDSTATYKAQVFRTVGGETRRLGEPINLKVGENFSIYGMEGLLWVFILLFTCIGIGAFNPSVGIGLYGVAFMMMGIIGIISMPLTVFFANTVLCILFIWGVNK